MCDILEFISQNLKKKNNVKDVKALQRVSLQQTLQDVHCFLSYDAGRGFSISHDSKLEKWRKNR